MNELELLRKVAGAAADWADACTARDAGAGGSSEYLRAREVLLRATVREYREHAVLFRPPAQSALEVVGVIEDNLTEESAARVLAMAREYAGKGDGEC